MEFNANVLDYLGRYEDGVLVLVSIECNGVYYDGTYFYNDTHLLLTPCDELDNYLGSDITTDLGYPDLIRLLMKKTVPYAEIINRLDEYIPPTFSL
jgi:hypothetical protein